MPAQVKYCSRCKTEQTINEFNRDISKSDGLSSLCRKCKNSYRYSHVEQINNYILGQKKNPTLCDYPQRWLYSVTKKSAERRNIFFDISYKDFISTYNGFCAISGIPLFCTKSKIQAPGNQNASPDRIDSKKGYKNGNIQWVDWDINKSKGTMEMKQFLMMCKKVIACQESLSSPLFP